MRRCGSAGFTLLSLTGVFLLAGCAGDSGDPSEGGETFVRTDSAGVAYIENFGPAWAKGEGWSIADTLLRLGAIDGEDPFLFTTIVGATRLSDGTIVVLDGSGELRAFSSDGLHLWSAGRKGEGPGEFMQPQGLSRLEGDLLQVEDQGERIVYSGTGEFVEHVTPDWPRIMEMGRYYPQDCRNVPRFLGEDLLLSACQDVVEWEPGFWASQTMIARLSASLDQVDTVGIFRTIPQQPVDYPAGRTYMLLPVGRGFLATGGIPSILVHGTDLRYRLEVHDLGAPPRMTQVIMRGSGMRPMTGDDIAQGMEVMSSHLEWLEEAPFEIPGMASALTEARDSYVFPDSISIVRGIFVDDLNAIWVRTSQVRGVDTVWDVFSEEGVYQGEMALPTNLTLREIGEDYILGVQQDEFDVQYLLHLALNRGGG